MSLTEIRMSFDNADDANVPVDIWLIEPEDGNPKWRLTAGNYMPRKGYVNEEAYAVEADSRKELAAIVAEKIIPLYRTALTQLESIVSGKGEHLYYWKEDTK